VIDFKTGTPVWDAISEIQRHAATLAYFDRFGVLQYRDVAQTTGVNWDYQTQKVISYNDKPDLAQMRDTLVIAALVLPPDGRVDPMRFLRNEFNEQDIARPALVVRRLNTTPVFPWSKMMFYVIPGFLKQNDLNRAASKISEGVSRPRASGSVTVPGNAEMELLDTFNSDWVIVGISHNISTGQKIWTTTLNLELLAQGDPGGEMDGCVQDEAALQNNLGGAQAPPSDATSSSGSIYSGGSNQ